MITSFENETWDLMNQGFDPDTGHPIAHVRQQTHNKVIVYRLVCFDDDWRKVGDISPLTGGFRSYPERRGIALSGSRIDLTLRSFVETGHGNAYA